jgi:hypothetical protein
VVGLAGDVAFDASDGFAFGHAVCLAALDVGLRFRAVTQPDQGDQVEGAVGVAVTGLCCIRRSRSMPGRLVVRTSGQMALASWGECHSESATARLVGGDLVVAAA